MNLDEEQQKVVAEAIACESDGCKKIWQSTTLWMTLLTTVAPTIPVVQAFIANNPQVLSLIGVIFAALRLKTKAPIQVKRKAE